MQSSLIVSTSASNSFFLLLFLKPTSSRGINNLPCDPSCFFRCYKYNDISNIFSGTLVPPSPLSLIHFLYFYHVITFFLKTADFLPAYSWCRIGNDFKAVSW